MIKNILIIYFLLISISNISEPLFSQNTNEINIPDLEIYIKDIKGFDKIKYKTNEKKDTILHRYLDNFKEFIKLKNISETDFPADLIIYCLGHNNNTITRSKHTFKLKDLFEQLRDYINDKKITNNKIRISFIDNLGFDTIQLRIDTVNLMIKNLQNNQAIVTNTIFDSAFATLRNISHDYLESIKILKGNIDGKEKVIVHDFCKYKPSENDSTSTYIIDCVSFTNINPVRCDFYWTPGFNYQTKLFLTDFNSSMSSIFLGLRTKLNLYLWNNFYSINTSVAGGGGNLGLRCILENIWIFKSIEIISGYGMIYYKYYPECYDNIDRYIFSWTDKSTELLASFGNAFSVRVSFLQLTRKLTKNKKENLGFQERGVAMELSKIFGDHYKVSIEPVLIHKNNDKLYLNWALSYVF